VKWERDLPPPIRPELVGQAFLRPDDLCQAPRGLDLRDLSKRELVARPAFDGVDGHPAGASHFTCND
jgi:hypothetical protein